MPNNSSAPQPSPVHATIEEVTEQPDVVTPHVVQEETNKLAVVTPDGIQEENDQLPVVSPGDAVEAIAVVHKAPERGTKMPAAKSKKTAKKSAVTEVSTSSSSKSVGEFGNTPTMLKQSSDNLIGKKKAVPKKSSNPTVEATAPPEAVSSFYNKLGN